MSLFGIQSFRPFSIYLYQILDLKKKQENQVQLLKQKQKSDEAAKRLQDEIQSIKAQKVGVHSIFNVETNYEITFSAFAAVIYYFELIGSIATKDKTRSRTISTMESIPREGTAPGISLSSPLLYLKTGLLTLVPLPFTLVWPSPLFLFFQSLWTK